jgi:NAD(P)-dependent dehydrogenase (short-subunit alcohol dehydrogenase family)
MDFTDLTTIRPAVDEFKARENRLDCLFNNAGIQSVTDDPVKTAQDWEVHFGVNVLAPFLLTHLLIPTMLETSETDSDVRVVWVCSLSVELLGEKSRGISRDYLQYWPTLSAVERYGISKAGSWLHGAEMAKRFPGITSVPCNPGHLKSNLYRDQNTFLRCALNATILYPPIYGAYTELVAGVSAAVTKQDSGRWMVPWGKWHPIRADLMDATRSTAEGGNGHAQEFWDWCLAQVAQYA